MGAKEAKNYSFEFWFENPEHDEWDQGGENYYVNQFYEDIVFNLDIPQDGFIVVLGTFRCYSFDKLCKKYGHDRCIGFDLYNPENHPRVKIKDCNHLGEKDNIPIAFCHNDLGSFGTTPNLKLFGQKWAAKNVVEGGYFLGNNNFNCSKTDMQGLMSQNGFENTTLLELSREEFDLSRISLERLGGYMISKKGKRSEK